ncbi:MAG TPA: TetR/AcrR family transcriptional regulator [Candidatus Pullilachnospira intestinigallinarum]|nr:TetR/AcrR family transcriptional regulator [Candidatus Pullilachnospira intestinigallinarum]
MDKKVAKTKKSIINAFLELRSKKALEKITVRELCEKAEINKSTFYTHFKDIYDLSEYLETQLVDQVVCSLQHPEYLFSKPEVFIRELTYAYAVDPDRGKFEKNHFFLTP